jgi:putative ABC transport system permease protein
MILEQLWQDLRYSCRLMRKSRLLTVSVVLTLALGIGANLLVFSVVRAVILRPLDYSNPDRLVQLWEYGNSNDDWVSFPNFTDYVDQAQSFTNIAAYTYYPTTLSGDKEAESVLSLQTTDRLFDLLGIKPVAGRTFVAGEDQPGHEAVAVISYALWQKRYGGEPATTGRKIDIGGRSYTIIGVMPSSFAFPNPIDMGAALVPIDVWIPVRRDISPDNFQDRGSRNFWTVARLKEGVSLIQARSEMAAIAARLAREYPQANKGLTISMANLQDHFSRAFRPALLMLFGAVGLLLLLACANIANLLLSRADSRRREMAIRGAIGASRGRLIRQTLIESVILSFLGAAAGITVIYVSLQSLLRWTPPGIPGIQRTHIDFAVMLFTAAVALAAGVLFGLAPAMVSAGRSVHDDLKRSTNRSSAERSSRSIRNVLIASQVALAVILLVGAGLLIRSLVNVTRLDPGFRSERLFMAIFNLSGEARYSHPAEQSKFFEEMLRRVRALPDVESAAVSDSIPLTGINNQGGFGIEGRSASDLRKLGQSEPQGNRPHVSAGYFETMGIQPTEGRLFDDHDRGNSPKVAVVSDLAARIYWPGESPLGKRLNISWDDKGQPVWHEIVGIVHSTRHFGLEAPQKPEIYVPYIQSGDDVGFMMLVVRTRADIDDVIRACRKEIASIDPEQAGFAAGRVQDLVTGSQSGRRLQTFLLAAFAGIAVFLAAIGIYGVIAYAVAQRAREVGIRLALGARHADVVLLIVKQGAATILAGIIAGVLGASGLARLVSNLLFGVSPSDVPTFSAVLALVFLVAIVSAYLPARRASRVDPAIALSNE